MLSAVRGHEHNIDASNDDAVAAALAEFGFVSLVNMLDIVTLRNLSARARNLHETGRLLPARVGRGASQVRDAATRGDAIRWIDATQASGDEQMLLARMKVLMEALSERLFLNMREVEAHYAAYSPGAGYAEHVDRFRDDDARVLSMVIYLNAEWRAEWGGVLRACLPNGSVDVLPELGRAVLFRSDMVPHAVLPAERNRYSIAAWFRRAAASTIVS